MLVPAAPNRWFGLEESARPGRRSLSVATDPLTGTLGVIVGLECVLEWPDECRTSLSPIHLLHACLAINFYLKPGDAMVPSLTPVATVHALPLRHVWWPLDTGFCPSAAGTVLEFLLSNHQPLLHEHYRRCYRRQVETFSMWICFPNNNSSSSCAEPAPLTDPPLQSWLMGWTARQIEMETLAARVWFLFLCGYIN